MRKLIAAMNMTLDGTCDHRAMIADDEIHEHYNDLLSGADTLLYGRITYQLMESYWPTVVEKPTGNEAMDKFAVLIDNLTKVVFSTTLDDVTWRNSRIAKQSLEEEVLALKQLPGKDILVGSPALIAALTNLDLIDELQLSVQPTIAGEGLQLFKNIDHTIHLTLLKTKTFVSSGSVCLYYQPTKNNSANKG